MSLRDVTRTVTSTDSKLDKLIGIEIRADKSIWTAWLVAMPNGQTRQKFIRVSSVLEGTLFGRATFLTMIDSIRDDTHPRAIIP